MKRWTRMAAGGALIIALIAAWTIAQQVRAKPPDGVLEVSGRIEGEQVLVSSKIGGRVSQLLVRDGNSVSQGQLIAVLRSEDLDARLRQAEAAVEIAGAQVRRAGSEVNVLLSQLGQARTAVALAQAQVAAQQRQAQASLTAGLARLAQARKAYAVVQRTAPNTVLDAQAMVRAAAADLARAGAARDQAQRELIRFETLQAAGAVAVAQVDAARANLEAASAQVAAATEQLARARVGLEQARTGLLDVQVREEEVRAAAAAADAARGQVTLAQTSTLEVTRQRQQAESIEQQLEIARADLAAAQAQDRAARAARDEMQAVRREASVYAPRAGVIVHSVANQGEVVAPGAPIVVLVDLQALWLKVYVPEPEIAKIRLGIPASVSVDAYPNRAFDATVAEISERAEFTPRDVQTREERVKQVFAVKLTLENRQGVMKPGMPGDAVIFWKGAPAP